MRIIRIRLKDFRGVEDSEVRFDATNVTVVEGPNESGKSSIADALMILRLHKDSTTKSVVKNLKPVLKDVGTEIELEACSGSYHFTYAKRFNNNRQTTLNIHQPTVESFTGDVAHERANALFDETLDAQLWDALQITQGASLLQPLLADIEPLKGALESSGDGPDGGSVDGLLERVSRERLRYVTESTGRPRGDYLALIDEVARLEGDVDRLTEELAKADRLSAQFVRNAADLTELREAHLDKSEQVAELTRRTAALGALRSALELAEVTRAKAEAISTAATVAADTRQALIEEVAAAAEALDASVGGLAALDEELQPRIDAHEAAQQRLVVARADLAAAEGEHQLATALVARVRASTRLAIIDDRVTRAAAAQDEVQKLVTFLDTHSVDDAVVHAIAAAELAWTSAVAHRDVSGPRMSVERLGPEAVTIDGQPIEDRADSSVVASTTVLVDGVIRITVTAGEDASDGAVAALEAEGRFRALLSEHRVADLQTAQRAAAERKDCAARLADLRLELATALGDTSRDELEQEHATLTARLADLPVPETETSDEEAERRAAEAAERAAEAVRAVETAQDDLEQAREARDEVRQRSLASEQRSVMARATHEALVARLTSAQAGESDEDLDARRAGCEAELVAASSAVDQHRLELAAADADVIDAERANAAGALDRLTTDIASIEGVQNQLLGQLEATGANGLQDEFDSVSAELLDAQRSLASMRARAEAADLLHRTIREHHGAAQRRYVAPFKAEIEALGAPIFGKDFAVTIAADLTIQSRTLAGQTIPFDQLSGGTREQLSILGRLACAKLVDPDEGAPLIVDDAFGFADDDRLQAMAQVFNTVGQTAQIIILTCYPRRFRDIGHATTVRLG